jgi:hypothetical protein
MSLSTPSHVSPTTGRYQSSPTLRSARACSRASTSRTWPTLCVLVSPTGELSSPDSATQLSPVTSPLPLSTWYPANNGCADRLPGCGRITVTPVRTGPVPGTSGPSPSISVVCPTSTPGTSVMAS